jgi:hypothetical protein
MRVEHPVATNLAAQPQLLSVGRQQQLDRGRVEADAVIKRRDAVTLVDSSDHQHRAQDLHVGDQSRIAREQRLDLVRFVSGNNDIDPRCRNVHAWQLIHDFVDLHDDNTVVESGGLHYGRCVFGIRAGVEVALAVRLLGADQRHVGHQVHKHPRV